MKPDELGMNMPAHHWRPHRPSNARSLRLVKRLRNRFSGRGVYWVTEEGSGFLTAHWRKT